MACQARRHPGAGEVLRLPAGDPEPDQRRSVSPASRWCRRWRRSSCRCGILKPGAVSDAALHHQHRRRAAAGAHRAPAGAVSDDDPVLDVRPDRVQALHLSAAGAAARRAGIGRHRHPGHRSLCRRRRRAARCRSASTGELVIRGPACDEGLLGESRGHRSRRCGPVRSRGRRCSTPATCSAPTRTASSTSSAARTTSSRRAARRSARRKSRTCSTRFPACRRPRWSAFRTRCSALRSRRSSRSTAARR